MNKIVTSALLFIALTGSSSAELYVPTSYPYEAGAIAQIRLREGPASNYNQIDMVRRGERLNILSCENAFCYAERQSGPSGWVHSDYFVPLAPAAEKPAPILVPHHEIGNDVLRPLPNIKIGF